MVFVVVVFNSEDRFTVMTEYDFSHSLSSLLSVLCLIARRPMNIVIVTAMPIHAIVNISSVIVLLPHSMSYSNHIGRLVCSCDSYNIRVCPYIYISLFFFLETASYICNHYVKLLYEYRYEVAIDSNSVVIVSNP